MIEVSIIMGHYSEDAKREGIARRCIRAVQPHRNETTEFILVFNGIYPYRNEFIKYCDKWHEREADIMAGKTFNIGVNMAKGNIIFFLCNDMLLHEGAVAECVRLIKKYPKYLVTPDHTRGHKKKSDKVLLDGYMGNDRIGDNCLCMTREQREDIGPQDEVCCFTDGINYINRWIAKGYTVMMTKERMVTDMAPGRHSFTNQMNQFNFKGYKKNKPIYSKEDLVKLSYA